MIKAEITGPRISEMDDIVQVGIAPHLVDMGDVGPVVMRHGDGIHVGTIEVDHGAPRIMLAVAEKGCTCGCATPGRGMMITPNAEFARSIGRKLIKMAAEMDRSADREATAALAAAIAKAAGKAAGK